MVECCFGEIIKLLVEIMYRQYITYGVIHQIILKSVQNAVTFPAETNTCIVLTCEVSSRKIILEVQNKF